MMYHVIQLTICVDDWNDLDTCLGEPVSEIIRTSDKHPDSHRPRQQI
jgi:hypothetical protein